MAQSYAEGEGESMVEQDTALKLTDVEFRRNRRVILTKVNLEIKKGEKWVLFGPNGIGKSSLVQMMSTRGFPSCGTVDILGNRLGKVNVFSYRNRIGLSSAELGRAFPPQEDPLDAIVTALTAITAVGVTPTLMKIMPRRVPSCANSVSNTSKAR